MKWIALLLMLVLCSGCGMLGEFIEPELDTATQAAVALGVEAAESEVGEEISPEFEAALADKVAYYLRLLLSLD